MVVFSIKVDGVPIKLLEPVQGFKSLTIVHLPGIPIGVATEQLRPICEWLYDLTQRASENVIYNETIISKDDIKGPQDIFKGK